MRDPTYKHYFYLKKKNKIFFNIVGKNIALFMCTWLDLGLVRTSISPLPFLSEKVKQAAYSYKTAVLSTPV